MQATAHELHRSLARSWRVTRDGSEVATVEVHEGGGGVIVATTLGNRTKPHQFASIDAADGFISDLIATFGYLGCDVSAT